MTDQASGEARARGDLLPEIQRFAEEREREEAEAQRVVDEMENLATPEVNVAALPDPTPSFNTPFLPPSEVAQQEISPT